MATTSEGYFQACDSSCRASKACAPEPSHDGDRVEKPGSFSYLPSQYSVYITRSGVKGELDNGKADLDWLRLDIAARSVRKTRRLH